MNLAVIFSGMLTEVQIPIVIEWKYNSQKKCDNRKVKFPIITSYARKISGKKGNLKNVEVDEFII